MFVLRPPLHKIFFKFSPVLVGSTIGGSLGSDSFVFTWLSVSALSFTVLLLGSAVSNFSTSPSLEFVVIIVSLSC